MPIPPQALELEDAWEQGQRDRELVLHLLFLTWYGLIEPKHITGFDEDQATQDHLQQTFTHVYGTVANDIEHDPEMLYVVGLMANLGTVATWGRS
ncbi:MAG: hypothetical protein DMF02_07750 [Verrucomicrobia bacterium]|nr:MAG: hypothetical protein DMF02_07750 [Verrucomicrobiota bacterium]